MFPSASPRGTLRVSGKQNSLFPLGPGIKCLLFNLCGIILVPRVFRLFGQRVCARRESGGNWT